MDMQCGRLISKSGSEYSFLHWI